MILGFWLALVPNLTGISQQSGAMKSVMGYQNSEIEDHSKLKTLQRNPLDGISASKLETCLKPEILIAAVS